MQEICIHGSEGGLGTQPALPTPISIELYRLVTTILDPDKAPARDLAAVYAQRWEVETSIKEIKTYQGRPSMVLRSKKPDGVLQELYGFLVVHYVIRWLIHQGSLGADADPDRASFTSALRVLRRKPRDPRAFPPSSHVLLISVNPTAFVRIPASSNVRSLATRPNDRNT